ncbi:MAG: Ig domain-containing protein [Clostridiales bacterium]|nr:Ig domain-containing protein [Clostridiales bacterium]
MPSLRHYIRIFICLCFVVVAAASVACISAFAADDGLHDTSDVQNLNDVNDQIDAENTAVADGIYTIVNKKTGLYLDVIDIRYDARGSAYLDRQTMQDGQDHRITRQEDGSYLITPQSDEGKYKLKTTSASAGGKVQKSLSTDANSSFYIIPREEGYYSIHPAGGENVALSVGGWYNNELLISDFTASDQQLWAIVPVKPRSIILSSTLSYGKVYGISTVTATVSPSYLDAKVTFASSDESVIVIDEEGNYCAIGEGSAVITATVGDLSTSCKINVSDVTAYTWYSQHNANDGGWNARALKDLYFRAGVTKPFIVDRYNNNADWMDEGCYVASLAMVLNNLGARMTEGYDFRTGQNGNLIADPYTVALANSYNKGSVTGKEILYNNPIYVIDYLVLSRFNVKGKALTDQKNFYVTKQAIKDALDKNPEGVIIRMNRGKDSHFLVFTKCINPDEKNPNKYEFLVCDPAAYTPGEGAHVRFEDSISYRSMHYRYGHMTMIQTIDIVK